MRIAVIGAGSWGTTVAGLAARNGTTVLWARRPELVAAINDRHENSDYLPRHRLPDSLRAVADAAEAVAGADAVVMGVPSHGFREVLGTVAPHLPDGIPVVSLTKGIEAGTLLRMTEIMAETLARPGGERLGVLTGPNLAGEVIEGQPTAAVIAMADEAVATRLQDAFMSPSFRVYRNPDVVGCELAGALKNVMAIAAGMARGLGFGQNTLAALITRALAELARLGVALGGRAETFAGLAGMGDLIATCQSDRSRNNQVGMALARGQKLDEIVAEMRMVAEGVKTAKPVLDLAGPLGVEMPIASEVARVLHEGAHPRDVVLRLMTRQAKSEQ
jgi:glycerol-3-phosphate dehydrogenase (NAD(P)+)